jgi:hypothetical protein
MSAAARRMPVEGSDQVHLDDAGELLELRRARLAEGLHRRADPGAVDEDVDAAEPLAGGLEGGAHLVGARDVGGREGRALAHSFGGVGARRGGAVEQGDGRAGREEAFRGGPPEPRSASGHDGFHGTKFHGLLPRLAF